MFTSRPIGYVSSPFKETTEVPKGLGAQHQAD
jgi:tRNA (adenine37-N6)-methyltransferase